MARSFKSVVSIDDQASASSEALRLKVTGESNARLSVDAGGKLTWGSGSASGDATLYRSAANALKTDDTFQAALGVITLTTDGAPSSSLADGAVAVDTTNDSLYFRSSSNWQAISNLIISDGAPSGPVAGDLWFESDTGRTLVYYSDGSSNQWVEVGVASAAGVSGSDGYIQFSSSGAFGSDANLYWDDTNNRLGVGTSSPAAQLQIANTGAGQLYATSDGFYIDQSASQLDTLFLRSQGPVVIASDLDGGTSNDYIAFTTDNNNERMRIIADGKVGIGTTTPDRLLTTSGAGTVLHHIHATDSNQSYTQYTNSTTGTTLYTDGMLVGVDTNETAVVWNQEATNLRFGSGGAERMTITSAGNVGIGTTVPEHELVLQGDTPTYKITSINAIDATSSTETIADIDFEGHKNANYKRAARIRVRADGTWSTGANTNGSGAIEFWTNSGSDVTEKMVISATGKVGIGTSSPTAPLEVSSSGDIAYILARTTASGNKRVRYQMGYGSTIGWEWGSDVSVNGGTEMYWYNRVSGTIAGVVTDAGKWGIGTTSPSESLHSTGALRAQSGGADGGIVVGQAYSSSYVGLRTNGMSSTSSGEYVLLSDGTHTFLGSGTGGDTYIRGAANATAHQLRISSTGAIFSGNVGIGTTSPARTLTVDGTDSTPVRIVGTAASIGAWMEFTGSTGTILGYLGMPNNDDMHIQATASGGYIYFKAGGTYRVYVNSSGYLLPYADNVYRFGSSSARWNHGHFYDIYSHDAGVHTSDAALKTDIVDTPLGLDFVKSIRPVQYRWLEGTRSHQGFIAQEVETVLNDTDGVTASEQGMWCVEPVDTTREVVEDGPDGAVRTTVEGEQFDRQSLRYNELMAPMVKAIQELAARVEALETN